MLKEEGPSDFLFLTSGCGFFQSNLLGLRQRLLIQLIRRAGAGRAHEKLLAIFEGDVPAVSPVCPVLRLVTIDEDHGTWQKRFSGEAAPKEHVRRARLERP